MAERKQQETSMVKKVPVPPAGVPTNASAIPPPSWKKELQQWKDAAFNWKARYDREHQRYISLDGIVSEKENEIQGLIRRKNFDVAKMVFEEEMSDYASHMDIQGVIKGKGGWNLKVTIEMVMLVLGIALVLELGFNQEFRDWMQANSTTVIVVAIAVVVMGFLFYSVGYKKKK